MSARPTSLRSGRWGGRLTQRELPHEDASIAQLDQAQRREVAAHWLERAAFEGRVGEAFRVIHSALRALGATDELVRLAARGVDDEARHAELARLVASHFAGEELSPPALLPLTVPRHAGADDALRHSLYVVGHCVLNETFASAVLEASLAVSRGPLARAALRELLSDEVDHARIGWGYLATLDGQARAAVEAWLPELVRTNLRQWRMTERRYVSDPRLVEQGALSRELLEDALSGALNTLIVPGFRHLGFATDALEPWLAAGAPT
jgi:hypothetical protein